MSGATSGGRSGGDGGRSRGNGDKPGTGAERFRAGAIRGALGDGLDRIGRAVGRRLARLYASDWASVGLTVAAVVLVGGRLIGRPAAVLSLVAGVALAVVVALSNSSSPLVRASAGAATILAALVAVPSLAAAVAYAIGLGGVGLVTGVALYCLVLASFAAALAPTEAPGGGSVGRAARTTILAALGVVAVVGARILPATDARGRAATASADAVGAVVDLAVHPSAGAALITWLGLLAVAAFAARGALDRVPVERLLPPERRDAANGLLERLSSALKLVSVVAVVGAVAAAAAPILAGAGRSGPSITHLASIRTALPAPTGDLAVGLLVSTGLRWGLLAAVAASTAVVAVARTRASIRRGLARALARLLAPAAGGALMGIAAAHLLADPALPGRLAAVAPSGVPRSVIELLTSAPPFVAAGAALLVALGVLWGVLTGIRFLRTLRILPGRATGPALAGVSLFGTAVVAALVSTPGVAVATAVAALVVWDVGEFGTGLREELPAGTPTFRVEIVHAGASILTVGAIGGATLWIHGRLAGALAVSDPRLAVVAVGATATATALVAFVLRG